MKLLKNPAFRIMLYFLLFLVFILLRDVPMGDLKICPFENFFGVLCPGCGTTRAFVSVLRFDFVEAFGLNPLFVLFILPVAVLIILQDIFCSAIGKTSFAEFVLSVIWRDKND